MQKINKVNLDKQISADNNFKFDTLIKYKNKIIIKIQANKSQSGSVARVVVTIKTFFFLK